MTPALPLRVSQMAYCQTSRGRLLRTIGARLPWHPIDYAFRTAPEELTLVDPHYGYIGLIRRLHFGPDFWYRGTT